MVTVVCTGGETPPVSLCRLWLDSAVRVLAADGGLDLVRLAQRKASLWIGDGDSLKGGPDAWREHYEQALKLPPDKDETDTEAAVRIALTYPERVWLLGGGGGRMDHWWVNFRLVASSPGITQWLTAHEASYVVEAGSSVELQPGLFSVLPLSGSIQVQTTGVKWPLERVDFSQWYSLSNRATPGARLGVTSGRVLLVIPHAMEVEG